MPNEPPAIWAEYDFYQLLGVPRNAEVQVIQAAIRRRIKEWHPDKQRGQSREVYVTFQELTKAVNVAKDVLLDPNERALYDRFRAILDQRNQSQDSNSGRWQGSTHDKQETWSGYRRQRQEQKRERSNSNNNGRNDQQQRENRSGDDRRSNGHERERSYDGRDDQRRQRENSSGYDRRSNAHGSAQNDDYKREKKRKRKKKDKRDRATWQDETAHERARTRASTSPDSAKTLGYVILALLALAAAGGLIYGFIQALPAIIDFLGTLFTWVIALGFWVIIIVLVLKSYSRN